MKQIKEILEKVYSTPSLRSSVVPLFLGNPGLGKTFLINEFAKEKGVNVVEIITSQVSPFEVSGICIPSHNSEKMVYYDFDRLTNLKDNDILFFDELLNGNPAVLNACLTLIESRTMISGKKLPNIMIVAAANPQGMAMLTPQIKERFIWYDIKFDRDSWVNYMINKYGITKSIGNKLSSLIKSEEFVSNNFKTPRSLDKAVNMMIHNVPTPYNTILLPILSEMITNKLDQPIKLSESKELLPNEMISWLDLMKHKNNII